MFTCGIATLIQVIGNRFVGARLPVVLGCTFTAVAPIIAIGKSTILGTIFGSIIVAGVLVFRPVESISTESSQGEAV